MGYQDDYKPKWLRALDDFADGAAKMLIGDRYKDWYTWIYHGLVAGAFTVPFALLGFQLLGASIAFSFYVWREFLTVWKYQHWTVTLDNCMDIVGPALVLGLALL